MLRRQWSFRRLLVLCSGMCAMFVLQIPWMAQVADAPALFIMPEIGIEKTIAQPIYENPGIPLRIRIPAIGVNAEIIGVGLVGNQQLDVPVQPHDVGWYRLGARPGEKGKAVLDGHLDIGGTHGVFWDLKLLKQGDPIYIMDDLQEEQIFIVQKLIEYPAFDAPMETIFGASNIEQLNLITCAGTWRKDLDHYDKRLVVFTTKADIR